MTEQAQGARRKARGARDLNLAPGACRLAPDSVNHPPHYQTASGLEVIEVIEAFDLRFHLGNAVKYILRAGKKGYEAEDLEKAIWYLRRHLGRLR